MGHTTIYGSFERVNDSEPVEFVYPPIGQTVKHGGGLVVCTRQSRVFTSAIDMSRWAVGRGAGGDAIGGKHRWQHQEMEISHCKACLQSV